MAKTDTQTNLRIPPELKAEIEAAAKAAGRSLTAEVVYRLGLSVDRPQDEGELMAAYERSEEYVKALQGQVNLLTRLNSITEGDTLFMADRLRLVLDLLPEEWLRKPEIAHVKRYQEAWTRRDSVAMAKEMTMMLPDEVGAGLVDHARMIEDEKSRGDRSRIERVVKRLSEPLPSNSKAVAAKAIARKKPKG